MVRAILLLILAVVPATAPWAAPGGTHDFSAEVDRRELYVNEHVLLTLSLTGSDTRLRAEGVTPNVDLTVLAGSFELGVPRADFRFNVERNRGRATSSIAVELFPRSAGRLRIPAFTVDGLSTQPIELRVLPLPADASPEAFVRSGVASRRLHAGEQTLLYLDLYHRVELAGARLGGPLESRPRDIEAHALPATERRERIDGFEYRVTRTAWAVSTTSAGELVLLLPDVWVETRQGRRWRLSFSEERIEVRALPAGVPPGTLIGPPTIENAAPGTAPAGEAVPWEITLRSDTALNLLPVEAPLAALPAGLRVYMDPPERRLEQTSHGVQSVAVYRGYLLAETPGIHETPAIRLPWYDAGAGSMAVLELPGQVFEASASTAQTMPMLTTLPADNDAAEHAVGDTRVSAWLWTTLIFALLWLLTLALWLERSGTSFIGRRPTRDEKAHVSDPRERLLSVLGARTLEQGLRQWEACHGYDEAVRESIREVQQLRYRKSAAPSDAELAQAVDRALARIGDRRVHTSQKEADDPWSPRAFRHAPPNAE